MASRASGSFVSGMARYRCRSVCAPWSGSRRLVRSPRGTGSRGGEHVDAAHVSPKVRHILPRATMLDMLTFALAVLLSRAFAQDLAFGTRRRPGPGRTRRCWSPRPAPSPRCTSRFRWAEKRCVSPGRTSPRAGRSGLSGRGMQRSPTPTRSFVPRSRMATSPRPTCLSTTSSRSTSRSICRRPLQTWKGRPSPWPSARWSTRRNIVAYGAHKVELDWRVVPIQAGPGTVAVPFVGNPAEVVLLDVTLKRGAAWSGFTYSPWFLNVPHEDVLFASDSAAIPPSEHYKLQSTLDQLHDLLDKYGSVVPVKLYIAGCTDTVGDAAHNKDLSLRRAQSIAGWLRARGYKQPIFYDGFGESLLAVDTGDGVDNPLNRRALYLVGANPPPAGSGVPGASWKAL